MEVEYIAVGPFNWRVSENLKEAIDGLILTYSGKGTRKEKDEHFLNYATIWMRKKDGPPLDFIERVPNGECMLVFSNVIYAPDPGEWINDYKIVEKDHE